MKSNFDLLEILKLELVRKFENHTASGLCSTIRYLRLMEQITPQEVDRLFELIGPHRPKEVLPHGYWWPAIYQDKKWFYTRLNVIENEQTRQKANS